MLIRLCRCAGWSAFLLFANPEDRFSRVEAHTVYFLVPGSALNLTLSKNQLGNEGQNYFYRYISMHMGHSIQSKVILVQ